MEKLRRNYTSLHDAFRALDRSNNGFISRDDFREALSRIFLSDELTQADVDIVAQRFCLDQADTVSYAEFAAALGGDCSVHSARGERVDQVDCALQAFREALDLRFSSHAGAFRALDSKRDAGLDREELAAALRAHAAVDGQRQIDAVFERFGPDARGRISLSSFCRTLACAPRFGSHLARQAFHPPGGS